MPPIPSERTACGAVKLAHSGIDGESLVLQVREPVLAFRCHATAVAGLPRSARW